MFFEDYKLHKDAKVRKSLFWEYDIEKINWQQMKILVVQRVIERGRIDDFYAILNLYGLETVKETIQLIPYLNDKDLAFVCSVFELKKENFKCYTNKRLTKQRWNS
jgi:hypothetical protein